MEFRSVKLFIFHIGYIYIYFKCLYMKFITLNLVVPAYTSKKRGITPILTLMNPTNPQLLAPPF